MKKYLLLLAGLLIGKAHAQEVRFSRYNQLPLQEMPGNGQPAIARLSAGDSVEVLSQPGAVAHVSQSTVQQYVFVRHAATQGWVARQALVGSRDSVAMPTVVAVPSPPASDGTARYVPVTEAARPYSAAGKNVRVTGTGASKPNYAKHRTSSTSRSYYTGPRGGCYYINSSGRKEYVDRSNCR